MASYLFRLEVDLDDGRQLRHAEIVEKAGLYDDEDEAGDVLEESLDAWFQSQGLSTDEYKSKMQRVLFELVKQS